MEIQKFLTGLDHELNAIKIPAKIGENKLSLSTRAISDMIEKYCIDVLMNRYGQNIISIAGKGKPYDVVIEGATLIYINIKTEFQGQLGYDAIWICSESALIRMPESLKKSLYYLRLEYTQNDIITIKRVSYAGPISALINKLIVYDKSSGKMTQQDQAVNYRIATHYNGKHVHLLTSSFMHI